MASGGSWKGIMNVKYATIYVIINYIIKFKGGRLV